MNILLKVRNKIALEKFYHLLSGDTKILDTVPYHKVSILLRNNQ